MILEDVMTSSNTDAAGTESPTPNAARHHSVLTDSDKHEGHADTLIPRFLAPAFDKEELGSKTFEPWSRSCATHREKTAPAITLHFSYTITCGTIREASRAKSPLTTDSNVEMALRLFNQDEGVDQRSLENDGLRDSLPKLGANVKVALKLYNQARGYKMLGVFQKDVAALYICIRHDMFMDEYQAAAGERKRIKRRKREPDAEEPTGASDVGGDSHAYDMLMKISSETKENLKRIKSRGARLLQYEATCGPTHPLWILLPAEAIRYHKDASGQRKYAT